MHTLSNTELNVSVLEPDADRNRMGSRYCTGGYIWQVRDQQIGDLFTGPEYPKEPNTFDGQGAPEVFQTVLGAEQAAVGGEVACLGVGRVRRTSPLAPFDVRHNREVIRFLDWETAITHDAITLRAEDSFQNWSYVIERTVVLQNRTVRSTTKLQCLNGDPLPVCWFAHPFFPIPTDNVLCRFSFPVHLRENPGYFVNAEGFLARKQDYDWKRGLRQEPGIVSGGNSMLAVQKHPRVGEVSVATDFAPCFMPVWGNDRTFSFEPYYQCLLPPDRAAQWSIEYRFRPAFQP